MPCSLGTVCISIHAPAKGATATIQRSIIYAFISIHAPAKGATASQWNDSTVRRYFNPRSREGSDAPGCFHKINIYIFQSTLPRRERLCSVCVHCIPFTISIHAPAKGATVTLCVISWPPGNFNPRSREGSDDRSCKRDKKSDISIHAPAKGATERLEVQQMLSCDFNPRSREGSDHAASFGSGLICNFNPRSREGSDLLFCMYNVSQCYFNPRSREGSDNPRAVG